MNISLSDIIPISQARARLTELAEDVASHGGTKLFTRGGEAYVALVPAAEVEELEQFRAQQHLDHLRAVVLALPEIQAGTGTPVADFRAEVQALLAGAPPSVMTKTAA